MKIRLREVTVGELVEGYKDDGEGGVIGLGGRLDIRPAFQREFVYKGKQRDVKSTTGGKQHDDERRGRVLIIGASPLAYPRSRRSPT